MQVRVLRRREEDGKFVDEGARHVLVTPQTSPLTLPGARPKPGDRLTLETAGPVQVFQVQDLAEWPLGSGRFYQVESSVATGPFATRWQHEASRVADPPDILVRLTDDDGNVLTDDAGNALVGER